MFAVDLLLGILVFGYIIVRQIRPRPVRSFNPRVPLILGLIGVVELVSFVKTDHDKAALVATLAGSLVLAAVMGAFRASTVRIWSDAGVIWSRGTWITVALWVVSLGSHLAYDYLLAGKDERGLGSASILLYLAVTFAVQRLIVHHRAQRLGLATGPGPAAGPGAAPLA
jgi:small basic protein